MRSSSVWNAPLIIRIPKSHSQCSESFYKKELESQIKTEPTKSADERRKMMELLKRFEEESAQDAPAFEEDHGEDDLEARLEALDIGASCLITRHYSEDLNL